MNEVREQIADYIKGIRLTTKADGTGDALFVRYPVSSEYMADQILSLVAVLDDDQSLPENPTPISTRYDDPRYMDRLAHEYYEKGQQDMLKARFKKVKG